MELILSDLFSGNATEEQVSHFIVGVISEVMHNYGKTKDLMSSYSGNRNEYNSVTEEAAQLINESVEAIEQAKLIVDYYPHISPMLDNLINLLRQYEGGVLFAVISSKVMSVAKKDYSTYLIKNPESKLVKIGKTTDMKNRIQSIQCGAGLKLEVLAIIDSDVERAMHLKFAELREFNEWFRDPNGDIESYFRKLAKRTRN